LEEKLGFFDQHFKPGDKDQRSDFYKQNDDLRRRIGRQIVV